MTHSPQDFTETSGIWRLSLKIETYNSTGEEITKNNSISKQIKENVESSEQHMHN